MISGMLAYTSLPQVKQIANHLTFKDFEKKSQQSKNNLEEAREKSIIFKDIVTNEPIEEKLNILEKKLKEEVYLADKIFSGGYFQSMFYFSCALNFIFILLGIFQQVFHIQLEWHCFLVLNLPFYFYCTYAILTINKIVKIGKITPKQVKWLSSRSVFNKAIYVYIILVPLVIFVENKYFENELLELCNNPISNVWKTRAFSILLIISVSMIPHIIFYKRDSFFYKNIQNLILQTDSEIKTHLNYIKVFFENKNPIKSKSE